MIYNLCPSISCTYSKGGEANGVKGHLFEK